MITHCTKGRTQTNRRVCPLINKADDQPQKADQQRVQTKQSHHPDWTGGNSPSSGASGANSLFKLWTRAQADEERGKRDKVERKAGLGQLEADQQPNKRVSLITTHGVHMHLLMSDSECIKTCW